MKEAIIEWKDFSFRYETQQEPTLQGIDLTIYKGEKVLIVGPSGSGKSTLGQCLNGIIPNIYKGQTYGEFLIKGQTAFDMSIMISLIWLAQFCRIQMGSLLACLWQKIWRLLWKMM